MKSETLLTLHEGLVSSLAYRGPVVIGRMRLLDLVLYITFICLAVRAGAAVLPTPLGAENRRGVLSLYISGASPALVKALPAGEPVWYSRNKAPIGRVRRVYARPAAAKTRAGWYTPRDLLLVLETSGRYKTGAGYFLGRNLPARIGETYLLQCTLATFRGRVEDLALSAGRKP